MKISCVSFVIHNITQPGVETSKKHCLCRCLPQRILGPPLSRGRPEQRNRAAFIAADLLKARPFTDANAMNILYKKRRDLSRRKKRGEGLKKNIQNFAKGSLALPKSRKGKGDEKACTEYKSFSPANRKEAPRLEASFPITDSALTSLLTAGGRPAYF